MLSKINIKDKSGRENNNNKIKAKINVKNRRILYHLTIRLISGQKSAI
jgi:hypothetical protein